MSGNEAEAKWMGIPEEAYSLRVPKREGEKAIRLASKLDLLNRELRIESDGEYLFIPLIRKPDFEIKEFHESLSQYEVLRRRFQRRRRRARERPLRLLPTGFHRIS